MIQYKKLLLILVLTASLFLASCGGGDEPVSNTVDPKVEAGKTLFKQTVIGTQAGCIACHSLDADLVIVGPSMAGVGTRAATRVSGMSAEEYLRQSILDPEAYLVDGFPSGTMPQVWGDELNDSQVEELVAYLLTLK